MDATNQPTTDPEPLTLEEAAASLNITVNAVRQRLKRGTLQGEKTSAGWVVYLSTDHETQADHGRDAADQPAPGARRATNRPRDHSDIAPLARLIADLTRQNQELAAAAALWQERARFLTERLQALEAGPIATTGPGEEPTATVPAVEPTLPPPTTPTSDDRPWWKRALGIHRAAPLIRHKHPDGSGRYRT